MHRSGWLAAGLVPEAPELPQDGDTGTSGPLYVIKHRAGRRLHPEQE